MKLKQIKTPIIMIILLTSLLPITYMNIGTSMLNPTSKDISKDSLSDNKIGLLDPTNNDKSLDHTENSNRPLSRNQNEQYNNTTSQPDGNNIIEHNENFDTPSTLKINSRTHDFHDLSTNITVYIHNFDTNTFEPYIITTSRNGSLELEVPKGLYKVSSTATNTLQSEIIDLQYGDVKEVDFVFSKISLTGFALNDNPSPVTLNVIGSDGENIWDYSNFGFHDSQTLYLAPDQYTLQYGEKQKLLDATDTLKVPVLLPESQSDSETSGISLSNTASFGVLAVNVTSADNMPVNGINVYVYNSSSGEQLFSGSTNSTGIFAESVNPIKYDVEVISVHDSLATWKYNITVNGGQVTYFNTQFARIMYYTNTDDTTYLTNPTDTTTYAYQRTFSSNRAVYYVPTGYDYRIEGKNVYNVTVNDIETYEVNSRIEFTPTFTSVNHQGRINANESTDITIRLRDNNFDYPLTLEFQPLHGSIVSRDINWISDSILGTTVTFDSPTYDDFYQVDFSVIDQSGLYSNYTLYLSDRSSTITLNATGADYRPLDMYIRAKHSFTGINEESRRTYGDGVVSFTLPDSRYNLVWQQDINYISDSYKIDANVGNYYFNYSFTEIVSNTTMHYGKVFSGTVRLYNGSTNAELISRSTNSNTGLERMIVPAYHDYDLRAYEYASSDVWHYGINSTAANETQLNFEFGLIGLYIYDDSTPLDRYSYLYNGTTLNQISSGRTYSDGKVNYIVAPYSNYTIRVNDNPDYYYVNISVSASKAVAVGDFVNTAPTIGSISASPSRINANESTIITIDASDVDPIDKLDYTWSVNVGSYTNMGNQINFTAPVYDTLYRIDINVSDQFGGWINSYIIVSNRVSTVKVNITTGEGNPHDTYVRFQPLRPNVSDTPYQQLWRTYSDGYVEATGLLDNNYHIYVSLTNTISKYYLLNQSNLFLNFTFAEVIMNSTTFQGNPLDTTVRSYINETGTRIANTGTGGDGLFTFYLRPDTYDFESVSRGTSIWKYNLSFSAHDKSILDFKFGRLFVNFTTAYGNPRDGYTYLYDVSEAEGSFLSSQRTYGDGVAIYHVAPDGNYSIKFNSQPNYEELNITTSSNGQTYVSYEEGIVSFYKYNGDTAEDVNWRIYYANTTSTVSSGSTNNDGFDRITMQPGIYDVVFDGITYEDFEVIAGENVEVGMKYNFVPKIESVSRGAFIGPDETTTVTIDVWDKNYDFPNLDIQVDTVYGSVTYDILSEFVSSNEFRIQFNYSSPSTLETYQLNITITDEDGGTDTYYYFVSDQDNTINLESLKGDYAPAQTYVRIYDVQSGSSVDSITTSDVTGKASLTLKDGYYRIVFHEDNNIVFDNVWIVNGDTYNFTAEFGEVDIYATGVSGSLIDTYIRAYNDTNDDHIISRRTYGDGLATFILAPGDYRFEVDQTVDIILYGEVYGGQTQILGSEVPDLNNNPELLEYFYGATNQTMRWDFSDNNPSSYNVTVDGQLYESGTWDGTSITVNFTGFDLGTYDVEIRVYDEYNYYNFDVAQVKVISPDAPVISDLQDRELFFNGSTTLKWDVNSTIGDNFTIYLNDDIFTQSTWDNGYIFAYVTNYLEGTYNFTIVIEDELGRKTNDTIIITVGADPLPQLSMSGNTTIGLDYDNLPVNYTLSDNNIDEYQIWVNDKLMESGDNGEGDFVYLLHNLGLGTHNVTIIVIDQSGQITSKSIEIQVIDNIDPIISNITDIQNEYGDQIDPLNWTVSDDTTLMYQLYVNSTLVEVTYLHSDILSYTPKIDAKGTYNITVVIFDTEDNSATDTVFITIEDTIVPDLTKSDDQLIYFGQDVESVVFTVTDRSSTSAILYHNDIMIAEYSNQTDIELLFNNSLSLGSHNLTIVVIDSSGNTNSATVFIDVQEDPLQFINSPEDQVMSPNTLQNTQINWSAMSFIPETYVVRVNGSVIDSGTWLNGSNYTIDLSNYTAAGQLNVEIMINNTAGYEEIAEFSVFIVSEELENFLQGLSNSQLLVIFIAMIAILIGIIQSNKGRTKYGRVF